MRIQLSVALVGLLACSSLTLAGDPGHGQHGCGVCCPTVKVEKVEDYCWEVRSKEICIPPVQFPWQKWFGGKGKGKGECGCPEPSHHCGKTRCVKYLWQQTVEKEECVYEWSVVYPDKGKGDAQHNSAIPADTAPDADVPPPAPVNSARAPAHTRVRIWAR
jgi:hypothetical protein